jgi:hypothetical protein
MMSQDYVLYAVLALIIVGIIMLVVYKQMMSNKEKFREMKASVEEEGAHEDSEQQMALELGMETFTNISDCPCADDASGCPIGCSCARCSFEPFGHTSEDEDDGSVVITKRMSNPLGIGSSALQRGTRGADYFRGDLNITSGTQSKDVNFLSASTRAVEKGAKGLI